MFYEGIMSLHVLEFVGFSQVEESKFYINLIVVLVTYIER